MMRFDDGHPVIQAAFGGHPSYPPGCGPGPRAVAGDVTADWLACGSGRFAFRAATTPLVDVQSPAVGVLAGVLRRERVAAGQPAPPRPTTWPALHHTVYATPPRGPLVQAENTGVCQNGTPTGSP